MLLTYEYQDVILTALLAIHRSTKIGSERTASLKVDHSVIGCTEQVLAEGGIHDETIVSAVISPGVSECREPSRSFPD